MKDKIIPILVTMGAVILAIQLNNRVIEPMIVKATAPTV